MTAGSGMFGTKGPIITHLETGHGAKGEIGDLRNDLLTVLAPLASITVEEFTAPPAAAPAGLHAATASSVAVQTLLSAGLIGAGLTALALLPRLVTFTTAGATPANAPATALITGTDVRDAVQSETVAIANTAATVSTVKAYKTITSIVYSAGSGAGATISVGTGPAWALSLPPKSRAGACLPVREVMDGAIPTAGLIDAVRGVYTPNTAPNATHNYAVYYEYVGL
mgnify:CR=1 FL=1